MRGIGASVVLLLGSCASEPVEEWVDEIDPMSSDVVRYDLPLADVWAAAEEAVLEEDVAVERRILHHRGGRLVVRRVDGHRVKVSVRAAGESTDSAVRVEPGSPSLAQMVQGRIGEKLSLKRARADLFGERTLELTPEADLGRCMDAAERACRAVGLDVVHRHLDESGGRLAARDASGRVVRITLRPADQSTGATLSTDASADLLRSVRREFERQLFPVAE